MKAIKIIILLCLISIYYSQDCTTPLDCYTKANQQLQRDRDEMRNLKNNLEEIINNKAKLIEDKLNEKIANIIKQLTEDFEKRINDFNGKNHQSLETMNNNISLINNDVKDLKHVNSNRHFLYKESIIYQDIFYALENGIISKMGNPSGWDETSFRINLWNKRKILKIGDNFQANENGLTTIVPETYDVLWLRVTNHVWEIIRVKFLDGDKEEIGKYAFGNRSLNELSPDGTTQDSNENTHIWCPIPVARSGKIAIYTDRETQGWLSGIAFGKNIWNHARNGALAYHWAINGGSGVNWNSNNWHSDILGIIPGGVISELIVPVVYSGKDKLLYLIEQNNNWIGIMHTNIYVNGVIIERFRTSYDNPFARHYNTKIYSKYIAANVPKELIGKNDKFISVKIDMTNQNNGLNINFREVGTHDYFQ